MNKQAVLNMLESERLLWDEWNKERLKADLGKLPQHIEKTLLNFIGDRRVYIYARHFFDGLSLEITYYHPRCGHLFRYNLFLSRDFLDDHQDHLMQSLRKLDKDVSRSLKRHNRCNRARTIVFLENSLSHWYAPYYGKQAQYKCKHKRYFKWRDSVLLKMGLIMWDENLETGAAFR